MGKFHIDYLNAKFNPDALWEDQEPVDWLYRKINGNLWMAIESWLVSRELTEMAGPWNEDLSLDDDGEYFCRIVSCAERILFASDAKSYIRRGTLGLSHSLTLNDRKLQSLAVSLECYIRTMLKMEDSPRTHEACLRLINRWSFYFHPERPDLYSRLRDLAFELGGALEQPSLRKKYRWIARLFGYKAGKKAQLAFPAFKEIALAHIGKYVRRSD